MTVAMLSIKTKESRINEVKGKKKKKKCFTILKIKNKKIWTVYILYL